MALSMLNPAQMESYERDGRGPRAVGGSAPVPRERVAAPRRGTSRHRAVRRAGGSGAATARELRTDRTASAAL